MRRSTFYIFWLIAVSVIGAEDFGSRYQAIMANEDGAGENVRLKRLFDTRWQYLMTEYPEFATESGFVGQNDRWTDLSMTAIERRKRDLQTPLAVLNAIDRAKLNENDQLNYDLFRRELTEAIEGTRFPGEYLQLTQLSGVQQEPAQIFESAPAFSAQDFEDRISRMEKMPVLIDQVIALLDEGLKKGITPPRITLRDVPQQVKNQLVEPAVSPLLQKFTNFPSSIPARDQQRLRAAAEAAYTNRVVPAYRKLHAYVADDYVPHCRESIAISDLPSGATWYAFNIRQRTTTDLGPRQIHELGLAEVKRIRAEMEKVIRSTGFKGNFAEFSEFLRTDPQFYYKTPEELLRAYRDIAKRADPELIKLFGALPRLPYGVLPVPSYAEQSQTTAYYSPGTLKTGRPGYFFANTWNLKSRPKWEMEPLTLHEAVPGHHLQIAIAQEIESLPEFRKNGGYTAFVEGWGLYAESLGTEMGFYRDSYAKFGQLTYEMWRAIRLVVDTGIHSMGWSRQKAIDFFKENASKAEHDIVVEVDRYIVWPGQALAYKIGELKIKELRALATASLGSRFDLRAFHDELLRQGALPLDVLEPRMKRWITAQQPQSP